MGMEVVSVNGTKVTAPMAAATAIRASEGKVELVVKPISLITAAVVKEADDSKLGITFSRLGSVGPFKILSIAEDGAFANTDLVPGLTVVAVNGVDVSGYSPADCVKTLKDIKGGEVVSIRAEGWISKITKESKDAAVGISLSYKRSRGCIRVANIADDSAFVGTDIRVGQKVVTINGVEHKDDVAEAIKAIKEAEGEVSIVTCTYVSPEDAAQRIAAEAIGAGAFDQPVPKSAADAFEKHNVAPKSVKSLISG